jgi:hypothetical protein
MALAALVGCSSEEATTPTPEAPGMQADLGNGYPYPGHDFQLLLIGVPKNKTADMDNNNGRRIFVQLYSDNVVTSPGGKNAESRARANRPNAKNESKHSP